MFVGGDCPSPAAASASSRFNSLPLSLGGHLLVRSFDIPFLLCLVLPIHSITNFNECISQRNESLLVGLCPSGRVA